MPKVSVVINTYNSAQYLPAVVESVLAQTFTDYELIVVDDGSTDNTRDVLKPYASKLFYIYQENKKYSAARNTGIRASSGKYVAFLDSDDVWSPNKLERQVAVLDQQQDVTLVHSQVAYIDLEGNPVQFKGKWIKGPDEAGVVIADQSKELFLGAVVTTSTAMVRRSALDKVGLFDEAHIHGEDWELWVRLASAGPFAYIPEPLVRYRVYGWKKVLTVQSSEPWLADQLRVIERASALWVGDRGELERLHAMAVATVYLRAALASFQIGKPEQGRHLLAEAISADSALGCRQRLVDLAVDRAKEIETESGSYQDAQTFIHAFFSNLPSSIKQFANAYREAMGWLYVGGAFEKHRDGDSAGVRHLLMRGVAHWPLSLKNRGVVSIALDAWLGKALANALRQSAQMIRGPAKTPTRSEIMSDR